MQTIDIYTDASVQKSLRGACAGALVTNRSGLRTQMRAIVQPNGTNNSGEIGAILLGVQTATELQEQIGEPVCFNIFSDSIIAIRGIREWIFHWIAAANKNGDYKFINSSGEPVANQVYFKTIFNYLIAHDMHIHFYHQLGHVDRNFAKAANVFTKTNGISLMRLGLSSETVSSHNNFVDTRTRSLLHEYFAGKPVAQTAGVIISPVDEDAYESTADNMIIPYIIADPPTGLYQYNADILHGKDIIKKYAECVFAMDYPSRYRIQKYLA